jgi:hypothetical protein
MRRSRLRRVARSSPAGHEGADPEELQLTLALPGEQVGRTAEDQQLVEVGRGRIGGEDAMAVDDPQLEEGAHSPSRNQIHPQRREQPGERHIEADEAIEIAARLGIDDTDVEVGARVRHRCAIEPAQTVFGSRAE